MQGSKRSLRTWAATAAALIALAAVARGSELSNLANGMQPGTWAKLNTNNIATALSASGASGFIFGYTEDIKWDPNTRKLLYVGGDHADKMRYVTYSESTNRWDIPAQPSWLPGGTNHGYDHMAIDVGRGFFYVRDHYYSRGFQRLNTASGVWSPLPQNSVLEYEQCCAGVEYFPEMDAVLWVQGGESSSGGGLFQYREATNRWERLAEDLPMGIYSNFMEYNPIHKIVIFGGGNDNGRKVYRMNSAGQITALKSAPIDLGTQQSVVTVDPVSGQYLVFAGGNVFYTFDALKDVWSRQSGSTPVFGNSYVHGIVGTSISTYGVNLFVKADSGSFSVHLYKHAAGGGTVVAGDTSSPTVPANVSAQGVSSTQVDLAWSNSTDDTAVLGYHVYRNNARVASVTTTSHQDGGLAASSSFDYSVSAYDAAGNESARSTAVRATTTVAAAPLPPVGGSDDADADFLARRSGAGVVRWFDFDSQAATDPQVMPPWGTTTKRGAVVADNKASGSGSLRFEIPSRSGSDTSGSFWLNFSDDLSVQFGEGTEFYVQWRQRFSPEFLNTRYENGGGWKQAIIGEGDRPGETVYSCTQLEIVTQNTFQRGIPQMYHSCGGKDGKYEAFEPAIGNGDFYLQNGMDCRYWQVSGAGSTSEYVPPCFGYKADQWMTFQVRVKIGTWYKNDGRYQRDSVVQLWVADEGQASKLVIDMSGYDIANQDPDAKYGKVWLLPYHTGKSSSQSHPTAYTWYDELIISTSRIPDPLVGAPPPPPPPAPDTVAPRAPSNLQVR